MAKRKGKGYCVFVTGAKSMKGIRKTDIAKALRKLTDDRENLDYVIVGNVRETEKVAYTQVRKMHLPVVIVPADYEAHGPINAEYFRNGFALKFFKPTKILIAHLEPEEESKIKTIFTWARNHNAEVTVVGPEKKVKVNK